MENICLQNIEAVLQCWSNKGKHTFHGFTTTRRIAGEGKLHVTVEICLHQCNHKEVFTNQAGNSHISIPNRSCKVTDWSLGLCKCSLNNWFHSNCYQSWLEPYLLEPAMSHFENGRQDNVTWLAVTWLHNLQRGLTRAALYCPTIMVYFIRQHSSKTYVNW